MLMVFIPSMYGKLGDGLSLAISFTNIIFMLVSVQTIIAGMTQTPNSGAENSSHLRNTSHWPKNTGTSNAIPQFSPPPYLWSQIYVHPKSTLWFLGMELH